MPDHDDLEPLIRNWQRLTPREYTLLQQRVTERAKAMRAELLRDLLGRFLSWWRCRLAIARLSALDDRMLKDIGLHRSEIEAAVRGRIWDHRRIDTRSPPASGLSPANGQARLDNAPRPGRRRRA